jgi:hypothetical protein
MWDAAFDCGLVTFSDGGAAQLPEKLSEGTRNLLLRPHPLPASPGYGPRIRFSYSIIARECGGHNPPRLRSRTLKATRGRGRRLSP